MCQPIHNGIPHHPSGVRKIFAREEASKDLKQNTIQRLFQNGLARDRIWMNLGMSNHHLLREYQIICKPALFSTIHLAFPYLKLPVPVASADPHLHHITKTASCGDDISGWVRCLGNPKPQRNILQQLDKVQKPLTFH